MAKIIVSYDGTENDADALALGRALAANGTPLELAYVRHAHVTDQAREDAAQRDAEGLLERGAAWLEKPNTPQHVVFNASISDGLAELAAARGSNIVVFGSEYRTPPGACAPQATADRLLDGGAYAIAIAPAGLHTRSFQIRTVAAVDTGDGAAQATVAALAASLGANVVDRASETVDLVVIGSRPTAAPGTVALTPTATYLLETVRCAALVVPRETPVSFA